MYLSLSLSLYIYTKDVLMDLLELSVVKPGAEHFAQALSLCEKANLQLDVQAFAKLIGMLVSREAPLAQLRVLLNLTLPTGAEPLPLAPPDLDADDARAAFGEALLLISVI